jgi:uncharacterized protein (DUF1684 family)
MSPPDSHLRWIDARDRALRDPEGWLALVALHWLRDGETVITASGDASDRCIVLDGVLASPAVHVALDADGLVTATIAPDLDATLDGKPVAPDAAITLRDDRQGLASILRGGRLHITHIHRQHRAALRIRDREAPTLVRFTGVERFPYDPNFVIDARFERAAAGTTVPITLITEHVEEHPIAGTLVFTVGGREHRLVAEQSGDNLFVVFGDETNRRSDKTATYGGGRFLTVPMPKTDGVTTLDFNRAVNPPCSFTPFATCPTPPESNRLSFAVLAGERRTH